MIKLLTTISNELAYRAAWIFLLALYIIVAIISPHGMVEFLKGSIQGYEEQRRIENEY